MRLLLSLLIFIAYVDGYKILFYTNLMGHSHVKFLAAAADTLTDAGHNVTVLFPVFEPDMKTSLKSTKNVIFVNSSQEVAEFAKLQASFLATLWVEDDGNPLTLIKGVEEMSNTFSSQCRLVLSDSELLKKIRAENYDLAVTEPFDACAYEFFEAVNIRAHVAALSCSRMDHVSEAFGQPAALSYTPALFSTNGERMNIFQRFMNMLQYAGGRYSFNSIGDADAKVAKEINSTWRSWREVLPEASFLFVNQIPLLDFPAPTFDKIIPIGGLSVETDKKSLKLEEKWSKILDIRKNNVFISFGSNARSIDMPDQFKKSLLQVFKSMPDTTFIWKYEDVTDKFTEGLDNVYLGDWLPQNELLADPRLNVFVTHGGMGSTIELAMMGKPAVMIPLFADQTRNTEMVKRHGGVAVIPKSNLANPEIVQETIEQVISDPSYRRNAERLAEMLNNRPTNPKETFVKHVEFAARFGKLPSLDNYGRQQSYIVYYFLDIIAIVGLIVFLVIYIFYRILKFFVRKCSAEKSKKD